MSSSSLLPCRHLEEPTALPVIVQENNNFIIGDKWRSVAAHCRNIRVNDSHDVLNSEVRITPGNGYQTDISCSFFRSSSDSKRPSWNTNLGNCWSKRARRTARSKAAHRSLRYVCPMSELVELPASSRSPHGIPSGHSDSEKH